MRPPSCVYQSVLARHGNSEQATPPTQNKITHDPYLLSVVIQVKLNTSCWCPWQNKSRETSRPSPRVKLHMNLTLLSVSNKRWENSIPHPKWNYTRTLLDLLTMTIKKVRDDDPIIQNEITHSLSYLVWVSCDKIKSDTSRPTPKVKWHTILTWFIVRVKIKGYTIVQCL